VVFFYKNIHCKKRFNFKFFPARESLSSIIPVGDGNTAKLFYSVKLKLNNIFMFISWTIRSLHTGSLLK
jgi:hypothetical protein